MSRSLQSKMPSQTASKGPSHAASEVPSHAASEVPSHAASNGLFGSLRRLFAGAGPSVHRTWLSLGAAGSCAMIFLVSGCAPDAPRALVLADGTGVVHSVGVNDRVMFFQQKTGRQVRVLTVPAEQAVLLASRGEADVAVIPMDTSLKDFLAREDGTVAGVFTHKGDRMKVLEVNAQQHPKVEPKGAHDLASAMAAP